MCRFDRMRRAASYPSGMAITSQIFCQAAEKPQGILCGFTRIFIKHGGKDASGRRAANFEILP